MRGTRRYVLGWRWRVISTAVAIVLALALAACGDNAPSDGGDAAPGTASKDAAGSYRLGQGGQTLIGPSGERIPIKAKLATGYVDAARQTGRYLDMSGWAAPADLSEPADVVVAVVGTKSVATSTPARARPDLVDGYNRPGLEKAGFAFSLPKGALRCSTPDGGVKTFAVAGDVASPMPWLGDVREQVKKAC
jgi:hypothetical protein